MTDEFVMRKMGRSDVTYLNDCLEPILSPTYGILVYQEQAIQIAKDIAGFSLQEADKLRKSIGKKDPELLASLETTFLAGCSKIGLVDEATAKELFENIRASQRYSFNKSHGVGYAMVSYRDLYAKAHDCLNFMTKCLKVSRFKIDGLLEKRQLIQECKTMGIIVKAPSLTFLTKEFNNDGKNIHFGLSDVKFVGQSQAETIYDVIINHQIQTGKNRIEWPKDEVLYVLSGCNKRSVLNLIMVGFLDHLFEGRQKLINEFNIWIKLTNKEKQEYKGQPLKELLLTLLETVTARRKVVIEDLYKTLTNPPNKTDDSPRWVAMVEKELLGLPVSCPPQIPDFIEANCTCKQFNNDQYHEPIILPGELVSVREFKIKRGNLKGRTMAMLELSDGTGEVSCTLFPDPYDEYGHWIYEGATLCIVGHKSSRGGITIDEVLSD